eukprot:1384336-Amorphochlora_amoeboformis.AAC.2
MGVPIMRRGVNLTDAHNNPSTRSSTKHKKIVHRNFKGGQGSIDSNHRLDGKDTANPFQFIKKLQREESSDEFVYLQPRGPYDLRVVKHDKVDQTNYFTMSRRGVTHFYHGATDFISLEQWQREYHLFTKLKDITFFKRFQLWKVFYFWNKFLRKRKNDKCRRFLRDNLYMLNPRLRPSLTKLQLLCFEISRTSLFSIDDMRPPDSIQTQTLSNFLQQQENLFDTVDQFLEAKHQEVRRIVANACQNDLHTFLVENGFKHEQKDVRYEEGKLKSIRPQEKTSHAEHAAKRTK